MPQTLSLLETLPVVRPDPLALLIFTSLALSAFGAANPAIAGCTVPFTLTTGSSVPPASDRVRLDCNGPWLRSSSNFTPTPNLAKHRFYCADQTVFSMWGAWQCTIFKQDGRGGAQTLHEVDFCVESTGPSEVDLTWDGGGKFTVNADDLCASAATSGFLGHGSPDGIDGSRDGDRFSFAGAAGERVRVTLTPDGTAGGTGAVVTLEAHSKAGRTLASKTASLPIMFDVALTDADLVLAVREAVGTDDPYRGGYILSVAPRGGKLGKRLLRPRPNVEP